MCDTVAPGEHRPVLRKGDMAGAGGRSGDSGAPATGEHQNGFGAQPGQREDAIARLAEGEGEWLGRVRAEFEAGFRAMRDAGAAVTVYGSARVAEGSPIYEDARRIGEALAQAGFTVITGGGPGVMEAANRGAFEAGGRSIGMNITLRNLEPPNRHTTASVTFKYFFVRKVMLVKYATAFVLMPGGMGTLDELFETLNLLQTGKIHRFPIILYGSSYWQGLLDWMRSELLVGGYISHKDLDIFLIEDTTEGVIERVREWHDQHRVDDLDQRPARRPRRALD